MPAPYLTPSQNIERSFSSEREFLMVITSASMSMIEWMMPLKFELHMCVWICMKIMHSFIMVINAYDNDETLKNIKVVMIMMMNP